MSAQSFEGWIHTVSSVELPNFHADDFDPSEPTPHISYNGKPGADITIRVTHEDYAKFIADHFQANKRTSTITIKEAHSE